MKFLKAVPNLIADMLATYHNYVERENAALRKLTQIVHLQQDIVNYYDTYYASFVEIFHTAILNTSEITHIVSVRYPEQLTSPNPVGLSKQGFYYANFLGWYRKGYSMTADSIRRILQSELDLLTSLYNFKKLRLFVELRADGRILFKIAFFEDVMKKVQI